MNTKADSALTSGVAKEPREVPAWRKVINFLCGIGSSGGDRQVKTIFTG